MVLSVLGLPACHTPSKEPSILDREFEAYRLDRDERRVDDLKAKETKARAEAEKLEGELAVSMRRIREARQKLDDARIDAESQPPESAVAAPPTGTPVAATATNPAPIALPAVIAPGALPLPIHRTPPPAPK